MRFLILAILLTGCAGFKPKVVIKEVEIPIDVPCVKRDEIPEVRDMLSDSLKAGDSIFTKTKAITIDLKGSQADNTILRALVDSCAEK